MLLKTLATVLITIGAASASASSAVASYYTGYQDMLASVNQVRAALGKAAFCNSPKLMASALKQSTYQSSIRMMTHDSTDPLMSRFTNQGYNAAAVAENVGVSPSSSVDSIMQAWIGSPEHKANILGDYTHFGSAVVQGSDGQYYWTQHFASSLSADEPCLPSSIAASLSGANGSSQRPMVPSSSGSGSLSSRSAPARQNAYQ